MKLATMASHRLLRDIFHSAAKHDPAHTAFICRNEKVSYGDFALRWKNMAARLQEKQIKPGERVAIALPASVDIVVAMAAVLHLGGVYVPLDRFGPTSRAALILRDCECSLLITDSQYLEDPNLESLSPSLRAVLLVDELAAGSAGDASEPISGAGDAPVDEAGAERLPDDLAFILYTSGSTGTPKGVAITHRNLLTFIDWALEEFQLGPDDTYANHANFTFDISTLFYAAVAAGAPVIIFTEEERRSPFALAGAIERHGIRVWYSVPSILQLMVASGALERVDASSLRCVLFAGEVFPIKYLQRLAQLVPQAIYYNLYGPTETNVCTFHRVVREDLESRTVPLPIGRALPGQRAWVADTEGNPLPEGERGELLVQGPCVTPGYWNVKGSRNEDNHRRGIHATGDLVTSQNGEYIFHGRIDNMIKLNGYRIELGEIESVLHLHPAIEQVAVVPRESEEQKQLVVCYVGKVGTQPPGLIELKKFCSQHLPSYMCPHRIRRFDSMPLNANGKVDREALTRLLDAEKDTARRSQEPAGGR